MPYSPRTSDRADAFVRRQSLWTRICDIFRHERPNDAELGRVSIVAECAIDMVFSSRNLTNEQCEQQYTAAKDFAECSALYGYVLGRAEGLALGEARARARQVPAGLD